MKKALLKTAFAAIVIVLMIVLLIPGAAIPLDEVLPIGHDAQGRLRSVDRLFPGMLVIFACLIAANRIASFLSCQPVCLTNDGRFLKTDAGGDRVEWRTPALITDDGLPFLIAQSRQSGSTPSSLSRWARRSARTSFRVCAFGFVISASGRFIVRYRA